MRDLKFRAWDKVKAKWIDGAYGFHILGEMMLIGGLFQDYKIEDLNDIILEQFTGLHSKSGQEIYEGDRVHSKWVDVECQEGEEYTGIITYEKGAFWLQTTLDGYDTNWLEVIGNIHENPELIKD